MNKKGIKAEDLYLLKSVADPQLSPGGKRCAFVETTIDKDEYYSQIKVIQQNEKTKAHQWTFGHSKNHSPRWSPNGKKLVFVSNRSGKNQLYLMGVNGGEARQLTFLKGGAVNPIWSPSGRQIAFSTSLDGKTSVEDKAESDKKEGKLIPLEVTRMKYKSDEEGFWKGHYKQIAAVDIETGEISQFTFGERDYQLFSWSPDGKFLAIGTDLSKDQDQSFVQDVFLLEVGSNKLIRVTNGNNYFGNVTWSPDGRYLGMTGHENEFKNATLSKLWVYHLELKELSCLTSEWDVAVGDYMISDFRYGGITTGMLWTEDSESFYFLASDYGSTAVYYGNLNGEIYPALLEQQHVYGLTIDGQNRAIVAISSATEPGDLYELTVTEGKLERLTNVNEKVLKNVILSGPESIELPGADGLKLQGWLLKPVHFEAGKKYPFILQIHGGPHMMYGNTYMHEFQMLSANGYVVMYVNPRGSHGYGQAFVDAVRGDYGGKDYQDLMEAVEQAVSDNEYIDKNRLGVTGGSYGGFMTNWIIGHTNHFKAAVTQRSISNWISFYGVSDIGYYFSEWQIGSDLSDIETLWKHSPLAYVEKVDTPLLILHSEKDYRCPIEQAEQMFISLKRLGKKAKFVRFPEENHELSRSGRPEFRVSRLNYIADWFNDHLN